MNPYIKYPPSGKNKGKLIRQRSKARKKRLENIKRGRRLNKILNEVKKNVRF